MQGRIIMNTDQLDTEAIDPRIKLLSYSTVLKLHECPRKFELYRLKSTQDEMNTEAAINQNITFAFGHIVGDGIQQVLAGKSEDQIIFKMFCDWHADLEDRNPKQAKSFYSAIIAIQKFISLRKHGFLDDYDVLIYNEIPALELSFKITFPDGFIFRGFVDAVLKHKVTGKIIVLECKTSSAYNLNPTDYKNSAQAIGYSVVLDVIAPEVSSYDVRYLVYMTKSCEFKILDFPKSHLQRASWIQSMLIDIESIKLYEQLKVYPMRGENCSSWGKDCEYLNQCTLGNKYITSKLDNSKDLDTKEYQINLTLMDLLTSQLDKNLGTKKLEGNTFDVMTVDEPESNKIIVNNINPIKYDGELL
jgi:hypothetical protein